MFIIFLGEIFKCFFDEVGLLKNYLIWMLVDLGVIVNFFVLWGVSGIFIMGMMKVSVLYYLLFVFFLIFVFVFIIIGGFLLNC